MDKSVKTYGRSTKKYRTEANYKQIEQGKTEQEPSTSRHLDINWPMIDPSVNSHELTIERVPPDNLDGLSGNRIVDLPL